MSVSIVDVEMIAEGGLVAQTRLFRWSVHSIKLDLTLTPSVWQATIHSPQSAIHHPLSPLSALGPRIMKEWPVGRQYLR